MVTTVRSGQRMSRDPAAAGLLIRQGWVGCSTNVLRHGWTRQVLCRSCPRANPLEQLPDRGFGAPETVRAAAFPTTSKVAATSCAFPQIAHNHPNARPWRRVAAIANDAASPAAQPTDRCLGGVRVTDRGDGPGDGTGATDDGCGSPESRVAPEAIPGVTSEGRVPAQPRPVSRGTVSREFADPTALPVHAGYFRH